MSENLGTDHLIWRGWWRGWLNPKTIQSCLDIFKILCNKLCETQQKNYKQGLVAIMPYDIEIASDDICCQGNLYSEPNKECVLQEICTLWAESMQSPKQYSFTFVWIRGHKLLEPENCVAMVTCHRLWVLNCYHSKHKINNWHKLLGKENFMFPW